MGLINQTHNVVYSNKEGCLVHISEVDRGERCGCFCVACNGRMIAKKGAVRSHHFAHLFETNCTGGTETILHMLSKELIAEMGAIDIPPYVYTMRRKIDGEEIVIGGTVAKGGEVIIEGVELEQADEGFIPDAIITSTGKKLAIEIAVTHKVGHSKIKRIRRADLPTIEIMLSDVDALLTRDELRTKLKDHIQSKTWLFHPKQREVEREFYERVRDVLRARRVKRTEIRTFLEEARPAKHRIIYQKQDLSKREITRYDQESYAFKVKNGRFPTDEECLKLWPRLFKVRV